MDVICKQSFLSWRVVGNQGADRVMLNSKKKRLIAAGTAIISGANRRYAKTILAGMCWTMLDNVGQFQHFKDVFPLPPQKQYEDR